MHSRYVDGATIYSQPGIPAESSGKLCQGLQNIGGKRSAVVSDADLCETDDRATIDDECAGIRCFLRGIPAEPIRIRENVIGISGDTEVRRQRSVRQELSGVLLH